MRDSSEKGTPWLAHGLERAVERLAALLAPNDLSEVEVEEGGRRVRVARGGAPVPAPSPAPSLTTPPPPGATHLGGGTGGASPEGSVLSPMVGTVYLSPEPGSPPFVRAGDEVREGQTLLIIEAMKVMNSLEAPRAGRVAAVLVEDSQPIEFGQPLVVLV